MKIAVITIAICEVIRLIQNTIQLRLMSGHSTDKYMREATDAFVKNLDRADKDFVTGVLEGLKNG